MKIIKSCCILFVMVCVLLSVSLPAFADMGTPAIDPYEVVVNPGGASTKDGGIIPEGTVLTITYEYEADGILWGSTEYNGEYVYVNLADVTNGEIVPKEAGFFLENAQPIKVVAEEGVDIRSGPGFGYDVLGTLSCEEVFLPEYGSGSWFYVECDGIGGWVYSYPDSVESGLTVVLERTVWAFNDAELYDAPDLESDVIATVPKSTVLTSAESNMIGTCFKVTYEGKTGWVFSGTDVAVFKNLNHYTAKANGTILLFAAPMKEAPKISDASDSLAVKIGDSFRLSCWTQFYTTDFSEWIYIETDDAAGWTPYYLPLDGSVADVEQLAATDNLLEHVSTEELFGTYDFIPPKGVALNYYSEEATEETEAPSEAPVTEKPITETEATEIVKPEKTEKKGFFASPKTIVLFCAAAAVVVALTGVVTLLILKKKEKTDSKT